MSTLLRQHAEQQFAEELHELKKNETNPIPENWQMSPQSVVTYLMGGTLKNGFEVSPKYIGNRRLMEIAVATPGNRPCPVTVRTSGNCQELGQRTHCGCYLRRFNPDCTRYGRNRRRSHTLRLELRTVIGRRPQRSRPGADSGHESHAGR